MVFKVYLFILSYLFAALIVRIHTHRALVHVYGQMLFNRSVKKVSIAVVGIETFWE